MKPKIKQFLISLFILILFFSMSKSFSGESNESIAINEENLNQIRSSGFWNLSPILIDNNWTAVNATHDWCTGKGTENDPYIIENVTIDAQESGSCIEIQNTNEYFIIQNCSFYNSISALDAAGIKLNNVANGKLISNYCYSNYHGISLLDSDNNTVSGNTASNNNYQGIYTSNSYNNTVSGNTASNNGENGIYLYNGDDNTVSENYATYNGENGIYLSHNGNNTVSGNTVSYNGDGISLYDAEENTIFDNDASYNYDDGISLYWCDENTIFDNNASYNIWDGICLSLSDENTISGNNISNNNGYGICLDDSSINTIFLNNFTNNYINAWDDKISNRWDNGSIGNYWDDYQGVDANNDGIGDTPYLIIGPGRNYDNFPIWDDGEGGGEQPLIPYGNYFLLFTIVAILSLIIVEKKRKNVIFND